MNASRQVGVHLPSNTVSTEQAPVMTVTQITKLEAVLVEYGDERGNKHTTVAFVTGGKAYIPPQGEQWTNGFRSFTKQISDQIVEKLEVMSAQKSSTPIVPTEDTVDIMSPPGQEG